MEISILGTFAVTRQGEVLELGGRKQRAVLAALVVERGDTVSTSRLVEIVWGDEPPAQAEASLQAYVSKLRRVLEPDRAPRAEPTVLVSRPGGYALEVPAAQVDATRFRDLVTAARDAQRAGEWDHALGRYDEALELWAPPLVEFEHDDFATGIRLRLEDLHADAVEARSDVQLARGAHREILGDLEAAVRDAPLREHRWYQLALARYRSGQQTEALRTLRRAREVLGDEAGLEPGPALVQLEADLFAQSPELDLAVAPVAAAPPSPSTHTAPPAHPATAPRAVGGPSFVGRAQELDVMLDALDHAVAGEGRVVVVSGEPGIGKTRLAEEVAREAAARGVVVGWTRCPESAATETLRPILQLGEVLLAHGLTAPVPLVPADGGAPGDEPVDHVDEFVQAVRSLAAAPQPFMAVVDDLQWADPSSLRVIEQTAADLRDVPVLFVVTVRPTDQPSSPALVECLGELARQPQARRLSLGGLDADDLARWIREHPARAGAVGPTGSTVEDEERLVAFLHDRTDGNPFFVQELVALLAAEDRLGAAGAGSTASSISVGVPDAVADVIRRRVSRLPASTQQLLPIAAIVGRTFDADVTAAVSDRTVAELLDDLDPAIDAGLVQEDPEVVGRYRFSHALVADALEAELSAARRARAHAGTARAIESMRLASLEQHLAELEHHALAGALAGTADLAVHCSTLAADRAAGIGAHEDEAQHRATTLRALELARPTDHRARYDTLVQLGVARRQSDDAAGAISAFADAIAVAEQLGDVPAMVSAAVLLNEPTPWQSGDYGADNTVESAVVERVLDLLPDEDSTVRAELLGALASFVYYRDPDRCEQLSADAVAMARRLDDPSTLLRTLNNRAQAHWRIGSLAQRTAAADEMLALVLEHDLDPSLHFLAEFTRMVSGVELGEPPRRRIEHVRALAVASGTSTALNQLGWFETGLLSVEARHEEAEALGRATYERYRRTRRWGAEIIYFGSILLARLDTGRGAETLAQASTIELNDYADSFTGYSAWALQELGEWELARAVLGPVGTVATLRDDWLWVGGTTMTALAVAEAGDLEAAAILLDRLAPYAGALAVSGTNVSVCSIDHALGRLHLLRGETDAALAHLDRAIELESSIGAVAWSARALIARALARIGSEDPDQRALATADLERARELAEAHGLVPVLARLDRMTEA